MADAATPETPPAPPVPPSEPDTLQLTPAELQKLVDTRIAAARSKWERTSGIKPEEREELDTLRQAQRAAEQKKLEEKGQYEQASEAKVKAVREELDAKIATATKTADAARGRLEKALIDNALLSAATKLNAIDAQDVAALLRGRVKLDETMDGVIVYDINGVQAYAKGGAAMTPEQLVESFLQSKPHLVRAAQTAPGGGAPGGRAATGDTTPLSEIDAKLLAAQQQVVNSRYTDTKAMEAVLRLSEEKKRATADAAA